MSIDAVVFDCDGVLVDSEPLVWVAWTAALAARGIEVSAEDEAACVGLGLRDTLDYFAVRGLSDPEALAVELEADLERRFGERLEPFADAAETVVRLAFNGIRLGVASSSPRRRLDAALQGVGLSRYFEASVAGDEVERAKPDPGVYLAVAAALGVEPGRVLAVEDSVPGVVAARDAGMRVVGLDRTGSNGGALLAAGAGVIAALEADTILMWMGR